MSCNSLPHLCYSPCLFASTTFLRYFKNNLKCCLILGFPGGSDSKASAHNAGDPGSILGWEDPLEKEMATHSSVLAWRIPGTGEPGGLPSMELHRVGHD